MVLVTCSSLGGDTVYDVQKFVDIPVLKVDEPMAEEVVTRARTVGILATAPSAAAGTAGLIKHAADESGKSVECKTFLCPEAGAHLAQGIKSFNEYLAGKACEACPQVDALVVAQLSMCGSKTSRMKLHPWQDIHLVAVCDTQDASNAELIRLM